MAQKSWLGSRYPDQWLARLAGIATILRNKRMYEDAGRVRELTTLLPPALLGRE